MTATQFFGFLGLTLLGSIVYADNGMDDAAWESAWSDFEEPAEEKSPFSYSTNVEAGIGGRVQDDPAIANDAVLAEIRNRWNLFYDKENFNLTYKADLVIDDIDNDDVYHTREANLFYRPARAVEIKLGRQILTWGTGDLVFLNDLFPKDWQAFFSGRDTRYLKAPSDALKLSFYTEAVNIDLVYTPEFDSDTFIDGTRISYFSSLANDYVAAPPRLSPIKRDDTFSDNEIALRLSKTIAGSEYAFYYYDGFYKSPTGIDADTFEFYFPELQVLGASFRTSVMGGIANIEVADYRSKEDRPGNNPYIPNDQQRLLVGYETEVITNFTVAFQYYLELTKDYDALIDNSPAEDFEPEEYRHLLTNRLTYSALNGNLIYSLFSFYSPSDEDGYLRPSLNYRFSDQLHFDVGGNYFFGEGKHTFFSRFENNSNLYTRVKYFF